MNKETGFHAATSPALNWAPGLHRLLLLFAAACLLMACGMTGAAQAESDQGELAATAATEAVTEYPEPLRGHWMPTDMACPSPINYDSDRLIVIDKDRLSHYEDGKKPVLVRRISMEPQAWMIESLLNIAGDGYDSPVTEVFVLSGGGLTIVGKEEVGTYRTCDSLGTQTQVSAESSLVHPQPEFPKPLLGVWDIAPQACVVSTDTDSDTRIEIHARILQGYENTDQLKTIEKISSSPDAWRVVTISNIAPPEVQGGADIYVLEGNNLTITNATYTEVYLRCQ